MSVSFSPSGPFTFKRPFDNGSTYSLRITNDDKFPVVFKVKTTCPKWYCVRPNMARVEPGDTAEVLVSLQPRKGSEQPTSSKCKDKFLVQSTIITGDEANLLPPNVNWSNRDDNEKTNVHIHKFRVVFLPEDSEDSLPERSSLDCQSSLSQLVREPPADSMMRELHHRPVTNAPPPTPIPNEPPPSYAPPSDPFDGPPSPPPPPPPFLAQDSSASAVTSSEQVPSASMVELSVYQDLLAKYEEAQSTIADLRALLGQSYSSDGAVGSSTGAEQVGTYYYSERRAIDGHFGGSGLAGEGASSIDDGEDTEGRGAHPVVITVLTVLLIALFFS